ncbi:phosphoenolpyruvate/phosphate translocator, putative [Plasmodium knowlesi strain H]|uniref:Phosphoenolpyruvate/phosphate translocator, putative n=3 Tax=Plasmodium knowlesi TaxID=5850 RepID=A0A5K1U4Z6_PLAKH|nr:phosphoenolpyruvate/phosphate translocator, putative [Plasmodium knowlesi strain H]OTN67133.1 putative Phosphoenolpyruvate/phosphate translocator [Plasmodium knowlesi]CAA9988534.1 phosphoenolpyruvate/phosphate translocator, putative [Plasmodium knowlesi strain H]SBO21310.1 phosphoenolpyruvate/phosphate translocator, putative [Plasmodium knowlesi strain H]SBO21768.1 phosphoenolpyruvate/phosphate translocator, putative [Plasmodium knowlesi strain H]VVS78008.1 phosphoenolpyruvate/phosphate tra|eukprot:XP_002259508.1 phosphoenolpyruvate/phosphate translocator precursor, putative [Plasmodium knowlesi strain H]
MNVFIRTLILTVVIKTQLILGRSLIYDKQSYVPKVYANLHGAGLNEIVKKTNRTCRNVKSRNYFPDFVSSDKSANQRSSTPLFINNYKPKYGKINRAGTSNFHIADAHNYKVKNSQRVMNALNKKIQESIFTLFNAANRDTSIYNNDFKSNKIIDDISSSDKSQNSGNLSQSTFGKDILGNNNDVGKGTDQKKPCTFLNNVVEGGKTVSLLGLWYVCNIFYNIENKKALNLLNLPITIAIAQIYVGLPIFLIPWILKLRNQPELFYDEQEMKKISLSDRNALVKALQKYVLFLKKYSSIMKQSIYHGYAHLLSVIAMGAGAISFVHIVKASSPLFAAFFSYFLTNNRMSLYTYSSLIPIVFGVSLASIKELSFTYKALYSTLSANVLSTMRAIEAKIMMDKNLERIGKHLTPENIFALLTLSSAIFLTPALYLDAHKWKDAYAYLMDNKDVLKVLGRHVLMSGVWFYLYNQLSFISLNRLNHITHAVASTVKRVFLILTSYFIFGTKFSFLGGLGSTMAVGGTFLYSLVKKKYG